jgi:hypothetical protein
MKAYHIALSQKVMQALRRFCIAVTQLVGLIEEDHPHAHGLGQI